MVDPDEERSSAADIQAVADARETGKVKPQ